MTKKFRYKNLFIYASLQTIGHTEEYFAKYTEKLLVFIVMPRLKSRYNLFRIYEKGKLIKENRVWSSNNILLYYFSWYLHHLYFLIKYIPAGENFTVFAGHPISLFGMGLQKALRKVEFAYWVGDYFPPVNTVLRIFEKIKKYYHDQVNFSCYLSDEINRKMNEGKTINTNQRKTIMWGIKPLSKPAGKPNRFLNFLFIGLVQESQGLELMFKILSTNKNYKLNVVGICGTKLYNQQRRLIEKLRINKQVYYPNKFFSEKELIKIAKKSHIGIALYNMSMLSATYYTDPGKIKTYTELGLPVIMSDTSAIADYIKKFKAGEVVSIEEDKIKQAIRRITTDYSSYTAGVKKFNNHFYYEDYYQTKFRFLEK